MTVKQDPYLAKSQNLLNQEIISSVEAIDLMDGLKEKKKTANLPFNRQANV